MSECSQCNHCITFKHYQEDKCGKNNPTINKFGRIHISLFKNCSDFIEGTPKDVRYLKVHSNRTRTHQDIIDEQHMY